MSTLKLNKKPATSSTGEVRRSPVRRPDPAKRVRTSAPARAATAQTQQVAPLVKPAARPKPQARPAPAGKLVPNRQRREGSLVSGAPRQRGRESAVTRPEKPLDSGFRRDDGLKKPATFDKPRFADRDTPRRGGKLRDGFEPGEFNRNRATNPKFSSKPAAGSPDLPRLSKRMAELGLCSRREADEWIANGWVMVNGEVIDTLGTRVAPEARIEVSASAHQAQAESVTILLHKPIGYVSGQAEDGYEPAVVLIQPENQWQPESHQQKAQRDPTQPKFKRGHLKGLAPAGRLDIDSTGLLIFTQDGRVARQLIGEDSQIEKEYLVRVEGELSDEGLRKLNHGLELDGVKLKPAKVSWQNEDQLRFVLREGRKRQIRRMCELMGLRVTGLKRVRIGSVVLGKLPLGQWRYLRLGERF